MYGAIFGDIIGSKFEFDRGPWTKEFELFTDDCSFTDDTAMTIAIGEALLDAGKDASVDEIEQACVKSMRKWGRKYPDAGYGWSFRGWLKHKNPRPYGSYGNGSAMRVSAAGWLYDSLERTREAARATANVTHNHPEGLKGAECTAAVIYLARTGASKEEIRNYVVVEFGYDISKTVDELRPFHRHEESCMDALPKALIAFLEGESYEDVVRNAVSLGGDTDTIAAIAGAMAEAFFGIPIVLIANGRTFLPDDMLDVLACFDATVRPDDKEYVTPRFNNNQYIKMAVEQIYEEQSDEAFYTLLHVLMKRMDEAGEAPTPMVDVNNVMGAMEVENLIAGDAVVLDRDMRLQFDTMQDENGRQWFPIFTDEEEIAKGNTANIQMNVSLEVILRNGVLSDRVAGVVINPFGQSFTIKKQVLEVLMDNYDKYANGGGE